MTEKSADRGPGRTRRGASSAYALHASRLLVCGGRTLCWWCIVEIILDGTKASEVPNWMSVHARMGSWHVGGRLAGRCKEDCRGSASTFLLRRLASPSPGADDAAFHPLYTTLAAHGMLPSERTNASRRTIGVYHAIQGAPSRYAKCIDIRVVTFGADSPRIPRCKASGGYNVLQENYAVHCCWAKAC